MQRIKSSPQTCTKMSSVHNFQQHIQTQQFLCNKIEEAEINILFLFSKVVQQLHKVKQFLEKNENIVKNADTNTKVILITF